MAIQGKGILDGFTGSLANVTGYKVNGKSVIKSKNGKRSKQPSIAQIKAQDNFKLMNRIWDSLITQGWEGLINRKHNNKSIREIFFSNMRNILGTGIEELPFVDLFGATDMNQPYQFNLNQSLNNFTGGTRMIFSPPVEGRLSNDIVLIIYYRPNFDNLFVTLYPSVRWSDGPGNLNNFFSTILPGEVGFYMHTVFRNDFSRVWNTSILKISRPINT